MGKYKCFLPKCTNTQCNKPEKKFFYVKECLKKKWCRELRIPFKAKSDYYCCEDHLNLKEDLENYYNWKLMNARPVLKPTASLRLNTGTLLQDLEELESVEEQSELRRLLTSTENVRSFQPQLQSTCKAIFSCDIGIQCKIPTAEKSTNYIARKLYPSKPTEFPRKSAALILSPTTSENPSMYGWTSETESLDILASKDLNLRRLFLELVDRNPKRYLGIPKQFWQMGILTDIITLSQQDKDRITELDLIISLFKIKQNDTFIRISEQFQVSLSILSNLFVKGVKCLANFFQNLIYLPSPKEIKSRLPTVFKIRYANVQCILDCFEIEIEKPSDPLRQAQTWSQYKSCNTLKYLIGCTPNGYVAFISSGYGGRISDKEILERSNLIDILPFNAVVMADRGFKEVETHLMTKGVKLLRPPSVYSGTKPTKEQVILTKVIASLRVHVERVIRRLREFRLLKPHSVVKYSHVGYMDEIVKTVCGLVNLQDTIIKNI